MTRFIVALMALLPLAALAQEPIGQLKTSSGAVSVTHGGAAKPAAAGDHVFQSDVVSTGADGAVGITFNDNSMMSLGPNSELSLDQFQFNVTTHEGAFESFLHKGTMAVTSGQITQQKPEAMKVRTPTTLLGVRGTEFVVRASDDGK
jgi:hypothetical protein